MRVAKTKTLPKVSVAPSHGSPLAYAVLYFAAITRHACRDHGDGDLPEDVTVHSLCHVYTSQFASRTLRVSCYWKPAFDPSPTLTAVKLAKCAAST